MCVMTEKHEKRIQAGRMQNPRGIEGTTKIEIQKSLGVISTNKNIEESKLSQFGYTQRMNREIQTKQI